MAKPVVVVFDTTEITRDPMCAGAAWQILAHRRRAWRVRVMTTEVVVDEATANYGRALGPALEMIEKFEDKFGRLLGLSTIRNDGRSKINAARDGYDEKLRGLLADASVEVVPPTKTSHMDIVRRATARRRPCNGNGDGYRDTLNWLTVIGLAKKYPKSDVVWVTGNTNDFQSEDGSGFHDDLAGDLREAGLENVRLLTSLRELAVELVANLGGGDAGDLGSARAELEKDVLDQFIVNEVMVNPKSEDLRIAACGLPYGTRNAQIDQIFSVEHVEVEVVGQAGDETSLAKFSAVVTAEISGEISTSRDLSAFETTGEIDSDTGLVRGSLRKPLAVEGILTIGNYGSPKASEIKSIEAQPGDPGVATFQQEKRRADAEARRASTAASSYISSAARSALQDALAASSRSAVRDIIAASGSAWRDVIAAGRGSALQDAAAAAGNGPALREAIVAAGNGSAFQDALLRAAAAGFALRDVESRHPRPTPRVSQRGEDDSK